METITFTQNENGITINIPKDLLKFVAENHEETPVIVLDLDRFQEDVTFQLEHCLGNQETFLTGFQELLDEAIGVVAESGVTADFA